MTTNPTDPPACRQVREPAVCDPADSNSEANPTGLSQRERLKALLSELDSGHWTGPVGAMIEEDYRLLRKDFGLQ
jgi:hypothetical protein